MTAGSGPPVADYHTKRHLFLLVACILFLWVLVSTGWQHGLPRLWSVGWKLVVAGGVLYFSWRWLRPIMGIGVVTGIVVGATLIWWTGAKLWDYSTIVFGSTLAIFTTLGWWLDKRLRRTVSAMRIPSLPWLGWAFCLTAWLICSMYPVVIDSRSVATHPARFEAMSPRYAGVRIGLSLSGGGYRAGLFHAGVLSALDDLHITPQSISCVSGGSIIGAFYVLGGKPEDFLECIHQRRLNLERELSWIQNVIRLPSPLHVPFFDVDLLPCKPFGRTDVQSDLLDRVLLSGKRWDDLPATPHLMVCCTDEYKGTVVGITKAGVIACFNLSTGEFVTPKRGYLGTLFAKFPNVTGYPSRWERNRFPGSERVSAMVAASGAFPLAFPPVCVDTYYEPYDGHKAHTLSYRLCDGGIADNSALTLMIEPTNVTSYPSLLSKGDEELSVLRPWCVDLVISSNAGSIFSEQDRHALDLDVVRAADIAYTHVGPMPASRTRNVDCPTRAPIVVSVCPQSMLGFPSGKASVSDLFIKTLRPINEGRNDPDGIAVFDNERDRKREDVEADLGAFLRTSTLDDHIDSEDASRIFRLGRYCLLKQFETIQAAVVSAEGEAAYSAIICQDQSTPEATARLAEAVRSLRSALRHNPGVERDPKESARFISDVDRWLGALATVANVNDVSKDLRAEAAALLKEWREVVPVKSESQPSTDSRGE